MRVTNAHPDAPHVQVLLNGAPVSDVCVDADTVGGYVVLRVDAGEFRPRYNTRTVWGKVELIDKRTGKPYDELYQVAEAAANAMHYPGS